MNSTGQIAARHLTQMQRVAAIYAGIEGLRMSFLIKSTIWLAIVFSCMEWPGGEKPDALVRAAANDAAHKAQAALVEKATGACMAAPAECLSLAGRAGTLAAKPAPAAAGQRHARAGRSEAN